MPPTDSTSGENVTEEPSKTTRISTHHESPFPTSEQTMYSSLSDQTDIHSTSMHPTTSEHTQYVWMINNQIYDYSTIEVFQLFFHIDKYQLIMWIQFRCINILYILSYLH